MSSVLSFSLSSLLSFVQLYPQLSYFSEIASSDYVERIVLQSGTTKDNKGTKQRKKIDTRRSIKSYFLGAWLVSDLQTL